MDTITATQIDILTTLELNRQATRLLGQIEEIAEQVEFAEDMNQMYDLEVRRGLKWDQLQTVLTELRMRTNA